MHLGQTNEYALNLNTLIHVNINLCTQAFTQVNVNKKQ